MATIKSYTDISQSKKLAEILPLESADMHYHYDYDFGELESIPTITEEDDHFVLFPKDVRCWSLAALLGVLPKNLNIGSPSLESNYKGYYYWIQYYDEFMKPNDYKTKCFNNPIDACVAMIEKLNELKML